MTGDDTDTVDRLFASKQVNDLRLIAATAFVVLLLIAGFAVVIVVTRANWFVDSSTAAGGVFLKLFAPTFAVFGAVLTWAY